jgi:hypothetical protein
LQDVGISLFYNNNLITNASGSGMTVGVNGVISADPMFIDPAFDFHLQDASPAVNAGSVASLPVDILDTDNDLDFGEILPVDIEGAPRINLCEPDMGAYENTSTDLLVINTFDSGPGSLRFAIECANNTPGPNTINFNIPDVNPQTILPGSPLPELTDEGTFIDGTSQPGYIGSSVIYLNGAAAGPTNGLNIRANNCQVSGLKIFDFEANGIYNDADNCNFFDNIITNNHAQDEILLVGCNGTAVQNNLINIDENGTPSPVASSGVYVWGSNNVDISQNTIAGAAVGDRALIYVFDNATQNTIENNFLGTDLNNNNYGGDIGILIDNTSDNNLIQENNIAYNNTGVLVQSNYNRIIFNNFFL